MEDFYSDNGTLFAKILLEYPTPDYMGENDSQSTSKLASMPEEAFAAPLERRLPICDRANTFVSAAYCYGQPHSKEAQQALITVEKRAALFGIAEDLVPLKAYIADLLSEPEEPKTACRADQAFNVDFHSSKVASIKGAGAANAKTLEDRFLQVVSTVEFEKISSVAAEVVQALRANDQEPLQETLKYAGQAECDESLFFEQMLLRASLFGDSLEKSAAMQALNQTPLVPSVAPPRGPQSAPAPNVAQNTAAPLVPSVAPPRGPQNPPAPSILDQSPTSVLGATTSPQPAPATRFSAAQLKAFQRSTGSRFNAASSMDVANMQRLMGGAGTLSSAQYKKKPFVGDVSTAGASGKTAVLEARVSLLHEIDAEFKLARFYGERLLDPHQAVFNTVVTEPTTIKIGSSKYPVNDWENGRFKPAVEAALGQEKLADLTGTKGEPDLAKFAALTPEEAKLLNRYLS